MSEHDHDEHSSFIKTPQQLIVVIVLSFVIPIGVISMIASLVTRGVDERNAASAEQIAKRLKPVGEVVVVPAPEPAPAAAPPAAAAPGAATQVAAAPAGATGAPAAGGAAAGKGVYDTACFACHGTGAAGAPKLGDKAEWAKRLKDGMAHLHEVAIKGKGAMPPKGGNTALSDADVKAAVEFMVNASK